MHVGDAGAVLVPDVAQGAQGIGGVKPGGRLVDPHGMEFRHLGELLLEVRIPADDATLICRCEEVTAGELRQAVALGCAGPNQAKAFTRCGMGPCQGRMCGLTVSELIAAERGVSVAEVGCYRVRPPVKPLTVAELAGLDGLENDPGMLGGLPTKQRA